MFVCASGTSLSKALNLHLSLSGLSLVSVRPVSLSSLYLLRRTKLKIFPLVLFRFENSELPVTEIEFPAVTICSQGLNMENVARAVERDFYDWHKKTQVMESEI